MSEGLWQWDALVAAARGRAEGAPTAPIAGFSIDSRSLAPGEVFIALKNVRDGHAFVPAALAAGAAAAVVGNDYGAAGSAGALIRVEDTLRALEDIARAARRRSGATIVAVTGSVGKTGTKEMLRLCLEGLGPTHASEKSFNNQWGVPLTLARMPPDSRHAVFEIGMNHPWEIAPLSRMVNPHVAVITAVEPVHLAHFADVADIARAKAEIFAGLAPGGTAVLPHDSAHYQVLRACAANSGARIVSFGCRPGADFRAADVAAGEGGSTVVAAHGARRLAYRLGAPGEHYVSNSLAVLAALDALGVDVIGCLPSLTQARAPVGRGARTLLAAAGGQMLLIDESYNANPASVRAALAAMATTPRAAFPRRVAVLGDMLELGQAAAELHGGLKPALDAAAVDLVLACGPMMRRPYQALAAAQQGGWAPSADELRPALIASLRAGDVVMVKGSLGMRMASLVEAMLRRYGPGRPGG
jgi:UDP-N-acetylmuramoyl-tripeptide--D-alanyl-D-alanine ligase